MYVMTDQFRAIAGPLQYTILPVVGHYWASMLVPQWADDQKCIGPVLVADSGPVMSSVMGQ